MPLTGGIHLRKGASMGRVSALNTPEIGVRGLTQLNKASIKMA